MKILTIDINFKVCKKKNIVVCDMRRETRTIKIKEKKTSSRMLLV